MCLGYDKCTCDPDSCIIEPEPEPESEPFEPVFWTITVQYDKRPRETSWSITDLNTKRKVAGIPKKRSRRFPKNKKLVVYNKEFIPGRRYKLLIADSLWDGFCCNRWSGKKGYILIKGEQYGNVWRKKISGKFNRIQPKKTVTFRVPNPLPI